ncbi:MAG: lysophospholipase [Thiohalocapsa sp.]|nr:lysophospholipase [Thiohalocapsa sp.]MCF7992362.1 lysophospholipase [Thiohalocapsa sp.]
MPRRRCVRIAACGALAAILALGAGCTGPRIVEAPSADAEPGLYRTAARMPDGYWLPVRTWPTPAGVSGTSGDDEIVVLALHGFNDYAAAFERLARHLAAEGIKTYALDQRGFGASALRRRWHGSERLIDDARMMAALLRERHPRARIYLVGDSMGAAVAINVLAAPGADAGSGRRAGMAVPETSRTRAHVDGAVLIAPAVWSRDTMPGPQRVLLDALARLAPGMRLTGDGVAIHPTDNLAMLRAMSADPLIIKSTRVDALYGVTNLMDRAMDASARLSGPVLLLYGERDDIIPKTAFCRLLRRLPDRPDMRLVLYRHGWHMLTRDRQGARVRTDIAAWLRNPEAPLPSGEETRPGAERVIELCGTRDSDRR